MREGKLLFPFRSNPLLLAEENLNGPFHRAYTQTRLFTVGVEQARLHRRKRLPSGRTNSRLGSQPSSPNSKLQEVHMNDFGNLEVWFVTGSQHLYGPETLKKVEEHATTIARGLGASPEIPVSVVAKPVLTNAESILELCLDANRARNCVGVITWMHTFSPARMWIAGLRSLSKPLLHLHTQFNQELPWSTIDMDFMNLNQSAHGDREFGFIGSRMRMRRKVIVGFWQDAAVHAEMGALATGGVRLARRATFEGRSPGRQHAQRGRDRWRQSRCRNQAALHREWLRRGRVW